MDIHFITTTFLITVGTYFLHLAGGEVIVFSVADVLVELDTYGHVTISRTNSSLWSSQGSKENNQVFLKLNQVRLLDRDGEVVKTIPLLLSDMRHFEITSFEPNEYKGVGANGRSMEVVSLGDAKRALEVRFFIFTEKGTIHPDVAPEEVNFGDVRVDVLVRDLKKICTNCTDIAALDLLIDVNGKEDEDIKTKLETNSIDTISITHGATIVLSDQLSWDGNWDTMTQGFPQLEAMEKYVEVTLRFPKFSNEAVYGLTVKPFKLRNISVANKEKRQSDPESDDASVSKSFSTFLLLLIIFVHCI